MPRAYFARSVGGMTPRPVRILIGVATGAYLLNCAWGTAVATGLIRTRRLRIVHHGLFVATASATGVALAAPLVWRHALPVLFLAPAIAPLAAAPRISARSSAHWRVALAAAPSYLGAVLAARSGTRTERSSSWS
jgi:hypothetical protein